MEGWELLGQDDQSYTVRGPNGQPMTVAKATLSPDAQAMFAALPGVVVSPPAGAQSTLKPAPTPPTSTPAMITAHVNAAKAEVARALGVSPPAPAGPAVAPAISHAVPASPQLGAPGGAYQLRPPGGAPGLGLPNYAAGYGLAQQGLKAQEAAAAQIGEAEAARAAEEAQTNRARQRFIEESQARTEAIIAARKAETGKVEQDILNGHVDPRRFWNSRSTGEKAMSMLGLVIAGIGSGLTGQPNAALGVIQRQMDLDIDAQKADLDRKQNLLGQLYQKYGNMMDAENVLRQTMLLGLEAKSREIASRAESAEAKARAAALAGQLQVQRGQLAQDFAGRMFQMQLMGSMLSQQGQTAQGGGREYVPTRISGPVSTVNPMDPGTYGKAREEQRAANEAVTVDLGRGQAVRTRTPADADKLRDQTVAYEKFLGAADQLERLNPADAGYEALVDSVATEYAKTVNQGQLNTKEVESYKKAIPSFLRGGGRFDAWRSAAHRALGDSYRTYADLAPKQFYAAFPPPAGLPGFTAVTRGTH